MRLGVIKEVRLDQYDKRVVCSLDTIAGSSLRQAGAEHRHLQEGQRRPKSMGHNLLAAFVISLMIGAVAVFPVLDALRHPKILLEGLKDGQLLHPGPLESIRPYLDLTDMLGMDVSDQDVSSAARRMRLEV